MVQPEFGKLTRVDPRSVWSHEARDFTPWLVEHIDLLGELLGLELEVVQREHAVGDFSVDVLAHDLGRDKTVVIENQLELTDHTHLGQLITYAAGLEASVVIWVSREIREEHRQALDWLNRGDGNATEYFGIVVELLQIDGSKPAVNLRVVASPNNWSRESLRAAAKEETTGRRALYRDFFQDLIDELREKHRFTNARAAQMQNWYSFTSGTSGLHYGASFAGKGRVRAELYIDLGDRDRNVALFDALYADRTALEAAFGESFEWERMDGKRGCRVAVYRPGTIEDAAEALEEYRRWAIEKLLRFKQVFGPRLSALVSRIAESEGST